MVRDNTDWRCLPEPLAVRILRLAIDASGRALLQWLHMSLVCRCAALCIPAVCAKPPSPQSRCILQGRCLTVVGFNMPASRSGVAAVDSLLDAMHDLTERRPSTLGLSMHWLEETHPTVKPAPGAGRRCLVNVSLQRPFGFLIDHHFMS